MVRGGVGGFAYGGVPPENYDISTHRLKAGCSTSELRGREDVPHKVCGTCRQSKPRADFNRKASRPDGLQEVCRECNRESSRRYYAEHRAEHVRVIVARTARRRLESKAFLVTYLRAHPCVDCGASDLRVLDFDHRPESDKRKDVMRMVNEGFSIRRLSEEIAKCDVRCRNCHAILTLERAADNWRSRAMRDFDMSDPGEGRGVRHADTFTSSLTRTAQYFLSGRHDRATGRELAWNGERRAEGVPQAGAATRRDLR